MNLIKTILKRGSTDQKFEQIDEYLCLFESTNYLKEQLIIFNFSIGLIKELSDQLNDEDYRESLFSVLSNHISAFLEYKFKLEYEDGSLIENIESTFYFDKDFNKIEDYQKFFTLINNSVYEMEFKMNLEDETIDTILQFIEILVNSIDKPVDILISAFWLLKRLYFNNKPNKSRINDSLSLLLYKIYTCSEDIYNDDYRAILIFLDYLVLNDSEFKKKFEEICLKNDNEVTFQQMNTININQVNSEKLEINNFHLQIGHPFHTNIESWNNSERIIEVTSDNSLIYISFSFELDLNIKLYKYIDSNDGNSSDFKEIFKLERVKCNEKVLKIICFLNSGVYKLELDNYYSWFNNKEVMYRVIILKPEDNTDFDMNLKFNKLKYQLNQTILKNQEKTEKNLILINFEDKCKSFDKGRISLYKKYLNFGNFSYLNVIFLEKGFKIIVNSEQFDYEDNNSFEDEILKLVDNNIEKIQTVNIFSMKTNDTNDYNKGAFMTSFISHLGFIPAKIHLISNVAISLFKLSESILISLILEIDDKSQFDINRAVFSFVNNIIQISYFDKELIKISTISQFIPQNENVVDEIEKFMKNFNIEEAKFLNLQDGLSIEDLNIKNFGNLEILTINKVMYLIDYFNALFID